MKNLPNALTILRIVMTPLLLWLLIKSEFTLSLVLFVFASFTDWLDGYLARKYKIETKLGALLDPLADKILTMPILFFFSYLGVLNLYILIGIILRDVLITGMRMMNFGTPSSCVKANDYGKYKVTLLYVVIVLSYLQEMARPLGFELISLNLILNLCLVVALVLSLMAFWMSYRPNAQN